MLPLHLESKASIPSDSTTRVLDIQNGNNLFVHEYRD
jgi:hypothetical protein